MEHGKHPGSREQEAHTTAAKCTFILTLVVPGVEIDIIGFSDMEQKMGFNLTYWKVVVTQVVFEVDYFPTSNGFQKNLQMGIAGL